MVKRAVTLVLVFCFITSGTAFAGNIIREMWSSLNSQWLIVNNSSGSELTVLDGRLVFPGTRESGNGSGLLLSIPLDLRDQATTVTVTFLKARYTHQMLSLTSGDVSGTMESLLNCPGLTILMSQMGREWLVGYVEGTRTFAGSLLPEKDGMVVSSNKFPLIVKWVVNGKIPRQGLDVTAIMNGETWWKGTVEPGNFDISNCRFSIMVINDYGEDSTEIGPVIIEQQR